MTTAAASPRPEAATAGQAPDNISGTSPCGAFVRGKVNEGGKVDLALTGLPPEADSRDPFGG
jgi:hypothetical protein